MRRGRPEFRIIYVTRLPRNDKIQQKQGSILYFFYFLVSFCELVDPNYLTRPTRILKNRIYQQKTKPVLFLVLWDKPDPWPEFRIIYVTRPTRIGRIQQKQGSNFLFIFLFFQLHFVSWSTLITWPGRPESSKIGFFSRKKRGPPYLWYCETGLTRIQNHIRHEANSNWWNTAKTRF